MASEAPAASEQDGQEEEEEKEEEEEEESVLFLLLLLQDGGAALVQNLSALFQQIPPQRHYSDDHCHRWPVRGSRAPRSPHSPRQKCRAHCAAVCIAHGRPRWRIGWCLHLTRPPNTTTNSIKILKFSVCLEKNFH